MIIIVILIALMILVLIVIIVIVIVIVIIIVIITATARSRAQGRPTTGNKVRALDVSRNKCRVPGCPAFCETIAKPWLARSPRLVGHHHLSIHELLQLDLSRFVCRFQS